MSRSAEPAGTAGLPRQFAGTMARLRLGRRPLLLAVSGGLDSTVLLDLAARWRLDAAAAAPELIVAHVDHGLHPASGEVARRVVRQAESRGLRVVGVALGLPPGTGETRAREARLAWLREARLATSAGWILTAHQADDQRETILMRLLHGSGPAGLAGMAVRGREIARPLLAVPREELRAYALGRGLSWWDDPANADSRHFRSWVRTTLLPLVEARHPRAASHLDEAGRHAARNRRAWRDALAHWPGLGYRAGAGAHSIDWPLLATLPLALQGSLVGALVRAAGAGAGARAVHRALESLRGGRSGTLADLTGGWRLELAFGRLEVLPPVRNGGEAVGLVEGEAGELAWGGWKLRWWPESAPMEQPRDGRTAWFIPGTLVVRRWKPGDRLAPLRGRGHRLAAECFREARITVGRRKDWPVVSGAEAAEVAWIPGVCRAGTLVPAAGSPALRLELEAGD